MPIANDFLAEFERQAPVTRRFLERVPEDKLTWKPHEKSLTLGQLALHIATVPANISRFVENNPVQARSEFKYPQAASRQEILAAFDEGIAVVRTQMAKFDDASMLETWRLMAGDRELIATPRAGIVRDLMLNHWYQHRGQLCVYLRLLNVPVPSSWGPSADEQPRFMQEVAEVA
jgi:uncharacterized damage-inducible protein DinB